MESFAARRVRPSATARHGIGPVLRLMTLFANVASGYFQLRELDLELEISKRALASRQVSLQLVSTKEQGGATSQFDVRQAEQLVDIVFIGNSSS